MTLLNGMLTEGIPSDGDAVLGGLHLLGKAIGIDQVMWHVVTENAIRLLHSHSVVLASQLLLRQGKEGHLLSNKLRIFRSLNRLRMHWFSCLDLFLLIFS